MAFCSEYVMEEIQNCYNISKCLPVASKEGFLAKKIRKLVKIVKPLLKKFNSSPKPSYEADNECNESKQVYDDQNSFNEHLEEEYNNHVNEMLEQQRKMEDLRIIALLPDGRSFAVPFTMLPWGADYDICTRNDVFTITKDQFPAVQVR